MKMVSLIELIPFWNIHFRLKWLWLVLVPCIVQVHNMLEIIGNELNFILSLSLSMLHLVQPLHTPQLCINFPMYLCCTVVVILSYFKLA